MTEPSPNALQSVLKRWLPHAASATISPLGDGSGFSGARLWRVDDRDASYVLRQWPGRHWSACRVNTMLAFQQHLAMDGVPAPAPVRMLESDAAAFTQLDAIQPAATWSLVAWMPGIADYWQDPQPRKLQAALAALARAHVSARTFDFADDGRQSGVALSPAIAKRAARLESLVKQGTAERRAGLRHEADAAQRELASEALQLVDKNLATQRRASDRWVGVPLPLQWRLGDVWHDHVLFTGTDVTGLIDFGAAGIDSPAGDVGRLLGSLVGDDRERWREGLAAYEAVRPLSPREQDAATFFDATGTVLAAANWVEWLWPRNPAIAAPIANRSAAISRLTRLVERLRTLTALGP
jgi:Ser/Thr protein kinase RdoA (MazF antagonist)